MEDMMSKKMKKGNDGKQIFRHSISFLQETPLGHTGRDHYWRNFCLQEIASTRWKEIISEKYRSEGFCTTKTMTITYGMDVWRNIRGLWKSLCATLGSK